MTDEENKAIEYLKRHILPYYGRKGTIEFMLNDIVLNLIEKQSKEIEELKKKPTFLIKDIYSPKLKEISLQDVEGLIEQGREEVKDKIKAMLENEIINISGFECVAKGDVQSLLEKE